MAIGTSDGKYYEDEFEAAVDRALAAGFKLPPMGGAVPGEQVGVRIHEEPPERTSAEVLKSIKRKRNDEIGEKIENLEKSPSERVKEGFDQLKKPRSDLGGTTVAHHEQSETVQNEKGEWINVYGRNTPKAGQQLPDTPAYKTLEEAVKAAKERSDKHSKR